MKTVISLGPLVVVLAVVGLPPAAFAQCVTFDRPEDLFARSDVVFRGKVVANRATGIQGQHVTVAIATFRVEQSWKGEPGRSVEVGADRPFEQGQEYLVFAAGEPLSTSILCRSAELIEQARTKLDWLAKRGGDTRESASGRLKPVPQDVLQPRAQSQPALYSTGDHCHARPPRLADCSTSITPILPAFGSM